MLIQHNTILSIFNKLNFVEFVKCNFVTILFTVPYNNIGVLDDLQQFL